MGIIYNVESFSCTQHTVSFSFAHSEIMFFVIQRILLFGLGQEPVRRMLNCNHLWFSQICTLFVLTMERHMITRHSYLRIAKKYCALCLYSRVLPQNMHIFAILSWAVKRNIVPFAYIQGFWHRMCIYLRIQLHELHVSKLGQFTDTNTYSYMFFFFAPCIVM